MRSTRGHATDAELAVLETLWDVGPATIRQLTDLLYPDGGPAHYATVQKLLERLEAKSCVTRRQRGRINVYRAKVERRDLIARRLRETADRLCGGSLTPVLTQLVSSAELTPRELRALRDLVRRHDRRKSGR
jgi:predicted transcriptional regulator